MELLPCPFCGSADVEMVTRYELFVVECQDCGAVGQDRANEHYAAAAWNRRATDPALLALARFGAEVLCESTDYCGSFACGLSMAALEHIALAGPVLDFPDVGSPTIRPGIASAIARLLAPDGTESEVAP